MLTISKLVFFFAAISEGALYLWDSSSPEMMVSDTWSIQEVRLAIVVLSLIALTFLHLWKEEKA